MMSFNQNVWCITLVNKRILEGSNVNTKTNTGKKLKFHVTEDDYSRSRGRIHVN